MSREDDGPYYVKGRAVFKKPFRTKDGSYHMGFSVCELCDGVSDDGAQEIAEGLNLLTENSGSGIRST